MKDCDTLREKLKSLELQWISAIDRYNDTGDWHYERNAMDLAYRIYEIKKELATYDC